MNFFAQQTSARKNTVRLLVLYCAAVAGVVLAVYTVFRVVLAFALEHSRHGTPTFWHLNLFVWTSLGTLFVIACGTVWRVWELRSGGRAVAEMMGGKRVGPSPTDAQERMLRNVVEEIAIASGVPVPEIYVLNSERAINAFAAGYGNADMAVAVTRGCLEQLTREELQGVIAHEFSHILNGDMRLNIHLLGVLHGLLGIYIAGRIVFEIDWSDLFDHDSWWGCVLLVVIGASFVAIGYLGMLAGRLIQAAVSRQREFLADASAVQFTRNAAGLAGALRKIAGAGSRLRAAQAEAVSHFFFANGLSESWTNLFATHPPIAYTTTRLDPSLSAEPIAPTAEGTDGEMIVVENLAPARASAAAAMASPTPVKRMPAHTIPSLVGTVAPVTFAAGVIESVPERLRACGADGWSATALVFALLLSKNGSAREWQEQRISAFTPELLRDVQEVSARLVETDRTARLPLLCLCLPALRQLSQAQWREIRAVLDDLVSCDGEVDLFEFILKTIIARHVEAHWHPADTARVEFYSFKPLADDFAVVLSALSHCASDTPAEVQRAFNAGWTQLRMFSEFTLRTPGSCGVAELSVALERLQHAVPHIRGHLVAAAAHAVAVDGYVTVDEAELLRAVADAVGCPVPPIVRGI